MIIFSRKPAVSAISGVTDAYCRFCAKYRQVLVWRIRPHANLAVAFDNHFLSVIRTENKVVVLRSSHEISAWVNTSVTPRVPIRALCIRCQAGHGEKDNSHEFLKP